MASTSASSVQKSFKYDVFLSFRGEDTRKGFVDHLYHALNKRGINTYKDDEKIQKGERISEQLIRSIQDSRCYIIVFSKNYASSSWCLDELVKIMECQKMAEHTAYPVFYDVEPTEVRHQSGPVGEAFAKLVGNGKRKRTEEDADVVEKEAVWRWRDALKEAFAKVVGKGKRKRTLEDAYEEKDVGIWRSALKNAASLAGWELKNTVDGHEAKFVEKIIEEISPKLHAISLNIDENLVGMKTRVLNAVSSLKLDSKDVRMIGIWGIGGGGKTTLARAIFNHIFISFESQSFVENVREGSKGSGLKELQQQVLQDVLNDQKLVVKTVYDGSMMEKMMCGIKVLVVLDDVDHIDQLKALAGSTNWFKAGSRIIITTRDEQVLVAHGIQWDHIYNVNLLTNEEAIRLFSRCAFKRESPIQEYEELSRNVVHYAAGLPLTITVLGSFLCGRAIREWEDAIERLKTIPWEETLTRLEISYDGLENDQKEIFLDVACLLKGMERKIAIRVLESRGFHAEIGLRVLEQKSLITVSAANYLQMHDHLEEMGMNIVRRSHPEEPNKHNRLWITKEIEDILVNDLGTNKTRSIKWRFSKLFPYAIMKSLRKMEELRVLCVQDYYPLDRPDLVDLYLPNSLQSVYWLRYPFTCLPKTFQANNLVHLELSGGNITQLWGGGKKVLNKLKFLVLKYLSIRSFDMEMTPNLQMFSLKNCMKLVELSMPVACPKLKFFNLMDSKVSSLKFGLAPCLENLELTRCRDLVELRIPVECPKLELLDLQGSKVSSLNIGSAPCLKKLNLANCKDLVELHILVELPKLKVLNLSFSKVSNVNLELIPHLEWLDLKNCCFLEEIHSPMGCLKKLVYLDLSGCSRFEFFSVDKWRKLPGHDSVATRLNLTAESLDTCQLHPDSKLPKFRFKCLYEEDLPSSIGNLEKLLSFGLCACTNLESFSASICGLQHLRELTLEGSIPEVPRDLYMLESLEHLTLSMKEITHIPDSICMLKHLKYLNLSYCQFLEQLPKDIGRLEGLEELHLTDCMSLRDIPKSICKMKSLTCIDLRFCILVEKLPGEFGRLESLEGIDIEGAGIRRLPQSIFELKGLCIFGSAWQFESYGFTATEEISTDPASWYIIL